MKKKYKVKLSPKVNYFEEAIFLAVKAAQWEGDFSLEEFHLVDNEEAFKKAVVEIDREFEDVYNFQLNIISEAIPLFKGSRFWREITKLEDRDVFKSDYLFAWSQNCEVSSIRDIDMSMFLRMNLEEFEDIYSNEGSLDGEFESLVNNHYKNSSWGKELDIKLEDILDLVDNTYFSPDKKLEILKIYIDTEKMYKEFQDKIGRCELIVKKYFYLVEARFNDMVKNFEDRQNIDDLLEMFQVASLEEYYSDEIIIRFNCVQYNGGSFRVSSRKISKTKMLLGILLFKLKEYSLSFEDSRDKLIEKCKAIGDETRFEILNKLSNRPYYVKELAEKMGISSASISHHLSILFQAGFIEPKVYDRKTYYNLKADKIVELGKRLVSFGEMTKNSK